MAVKQQDIARHLGVSRPWVARALGGDPRISEQSRRKVRAAADKLGYRPNAAAQALVRGRANMIAIWSPFLELPIYNRYVNQLKAVANAAGSQAFIRDALTDPGEWNWPVDGIICIDSPSQLRAYRAALSGAGGEGATVPIVSLGVLESEDVDQVVLDFEVGTEEALRDLVRRGCRKIAYLLPRHARRKVDDGRFIAYRRIMSESNAAERLIVANSMSAADAYATVRDSVREHGLPDGILVFLSSMSIGALRALGEIGAKMPGDVALATVDDSPDISYFTPSLSAVEVPIEQAATEAWRLLRFRQQNPTAPRQRVVLPTRFIPRESSQ